MKQDNAGKILSSKERAVVADEVAERENLKHEMGITTHFYQLHFQGHVMPPWVVDRLCTTFRKTQNGHFEAKFKALQSTTKFNINAVLLETEDDEYHNHQPGASHLQGGGFWDTEEQDKWFTHPGKLSNPPKSVTKVSSSKGIWNITTR